MRSAGDPDAVRAIGRATEDLGYDYLLAYDHVVGSVRADREPKLWGPYNEHDPFHDPLVMFSYLAGMTERISFATGVIILPQRQTALVAKQAADLDLLSGGRLRLGVGVGWNWVEYDALGQDFSTRGKRANEQIDLLRQLWTGEVLDFKGRFDTIDRGNILPAPTKSIPIWIGGFSDPAYRRGVDLGDGFMFGGTRKHIDKAVERVEHFAAEAGRDLSTFGQEWLIQTAKLSVSEIVEQVAYWRDRGGTHCSIVSMNRGLDSTARSRRYGEPTAPVRLTTGLRSS